ncbi:peptidoglycan-binding protein [Streptomyces sp. NPDC091267]|uniref:peptidoglycan-binding protein n=1 Tax=Streptomyces sp. NPDC091267 TaxID=3155195 RepID=UPI00342BC537
MTADQFVARLKAEGVTVIEHAGWRTHNRAGHGSWGPMNGVVIHHTAGRDSLSLVYNGTSALPGPLCHTHLSKSGVATMVGNGRANHAGTFATNAFNAMMNENKTHPRPDAAEPVDANARTYGIEIENLGNGTDFYPDAQYDAAVRWAAAICRFHGWSAQSVIGHKEGTRRKIDPKGPIGSAKGPLWDMDTFRADVQKRIDTDKPSTTTPKPSTPAKPTYEPYPGASFFKTGRKSPIVAAMHKRLVAVGCNKYKSNTNADVWGSGDVASYATWQRKRGATGKGADGIPGKATWDALKVPNV